MTGGTIMGQLYEYSTKIQQHIEANGLDVFRTRGELAIKCGFLVTLIDENEPDDPAKLTALREAAREVLGLQLG